MIRGQVQRREDVGFFASGSEAEEGGDAAAVFAYAAIDGFDENAGDTWG